MVASEYLPLSSNTVPYQGSSPPIRQSYPRRKPLIPAYPASVNPKQDRHRRQSQRHKPQQTIPPSPSQSIIQTQSTKWKQRPRCSSEHRIRPDRAGRILLKRIDQIRLYPREHNNRPESRNCRADLRNDPMRFRLRRPAIHEQSCWERQGSRQGNHQGKSIFRSGGFSLHRSSASNTFVAEEREVIYTEQSPYSPGEKD